MKPRLIVPNPMAQLTNRCNQMVARVYTLLLSIAASTQQGRPLLRHSSHPSIIVWTCAQTLISLIKIPIAQPSLIWYKEDLREIVGPRARVLYSLPMAVLLRGYCSCEAMESYYTWDGEKANMILLVNTVVPHVMSPDSGTRPKPQHTPLQHRPFPTSPFARRFVAHS